MNLDKIIITRQQQFGLVAFRAQQEERDNLKDIDFLDFYAKWQFEKGYFDDSYLIASSFKKDEIHD